MTGGTGTDGGRNVSQVVPFLRVLDLERSVRYYVDGLGFTMTNRWVVDGQLRWCWLQLGGAALMLQELHADRRPEGKVGQGVSLAFQCADALALHREVTARGLEAAEPFVGNALWVVLLKDPDGYALEFASPTDVPEETKLSEWSGRSQETR